MRGRPAHAAIHAPQGKARQERRIAYPGHGKARDTRRTACLRTEMARQTTARTCPGRSGIHPPGGGNLAAALTSLAVADGNTPVRDPTTSWDGRRGPAPKLAPGRCTRQVLSTCISRETSPKLRTVEREAGPSAQLMKAEGIGTSNSVLLLPFRILL